jgi:hypothetical protein
MNRKAMREEPVAASVRAQFDAWRGQRRRGERIPEELWRAAGGAARAHGVHAVSRALGLDYVQLKQRVGGLVQRRPMPERSPTMFVEVKGPAAESAAACVVELEKSNGTRMRICVREAATVDWCRMKEAFLGA